jgi:predicted transcriptional regulator
VDGRINWSGERDLYVTGNESFSQVAKRLGVTKSAVEKHASNREANGGRTWGEWREEFRAEISGKTTEISKRIKVEAAATVAMQHAQMLANLASEAREAIKNALEECEPKDKIKLALAIIAVERRVHGLDRSPVQLEVTGKDGKAIEHDLTIDFDNDADARDLAQRTLEAVFGQAPVEAGAPTTS